LLFIEGKTKEEIFIELSEVVFMLAISDKATENHLHILNQLFTLAQSEA